MKMPLVVTMLTAFTSPLALAQTDEDTRMEEVVVSASATTQVLREAPAAMSVITREQLLERPVRDVLDAVRESVGVTLSGAGFTRRSINIRGMDGGHTLFLVDGRRVNASADVIAHSDFELGWIPPQAIAQIEMVRGPMSALYGSEALGGVINVITRPVTDTWSGNITLLHGEPSGSGGGERQTGAYVAGPLIEDRLGVRAYLDYQKRDNTPSAADPALSGTEARRAETGGATFSYTPAPEHRIDLSLQRADDLRRRDARTAGPAHLARDYVYRDDVRRQQIDVHYNGDFQSFALEAGAYRSTLERENRGSDLLAPPSEQELSSDIVEGRVRFERGSHRLLAGGEYRHETLDDGSLITTGSESATVHSLYLQDNIALPVEDVTLTLGLRADDHEQFGTEYSPRAYLVWQVSDSLTLRGGYGEGFKAPTLKQLSPQYSAFGGGGRFEITGNPQLQPETSRSVELGLLHQAGRLRTEATIYENRLRDLVQTECFVNCGQFGLERRQYVNVAEARLRGFEFASSVTLPLGFDAGVNYSYLDAVDRESDERLLERPRHSATARLGWNQGPWSAHLRVQRVGSQLRTVDNAVATLPYYSLWHLGGAWEVTTTVTLRAGIENLTDERLSERSELFTYDERRRYAYFSANLNF
ncbi:TonB-dependent receptor domain-containing protein [Kineobactrum salinum]|uniref:TonB-dependent receptor n=1 Tax=Kineobactrum salinum TaxID=2708301 RepID=A0A6C0U6N9_9GAMM|nr:TonB-dependent receptor [Kineobactrum salinum]QIB66105.1 TonB-dependent receptor [Kineobactrum salinum]